MKKRTILWKLFWSTLCLSAFTFGGGYVIVSLMKKRFVDEFHWIEEEQMLDLVSIAQCAPGPIAVNGAIVVGYQLAGGIGALVAIVATILPPFLILTLVSFFYRIFSGSRIVSTLLSGMQAGVAAVIASVVWDLGTDAGKSGGAPSVCIMAAAFMLACVLRVNTVYLVLGCIALGTVRALIAGRRKRA